MNPIGINRIPMSSPGTGQPANTTQVQPGETTLQQVAQRLMLLEKQLMALNPQLPNPQNLNPGQLLNVPASAAATPFAAAGSSPAPAPAPQPSASKSMESQLASMMMKQQVQQMSQPQGFNALVPVSVPLPQIPPAPGSSAGSQQATTPTGPWTASQLSNTFTAQDLQNISDPAGFINARLAAQQPPTNAVMVNNNDGTSQPLNPAQMSSSDQAAAMEQILKGLGLNPPPAQAINVGGGPFGVNYENDPRRHYYIGGMDVGLMVQLYAMYPKATADQMILSQVQQSGFGTSPASLTPGGS